MAFNTRYTRLLTLVLMICMFWLVTACTDPATQSPVESNELNGDENTQDQSSNHAIDDPPIELSPPDEEPIEAEPEPYTVEASLIAVGDIMTHMPQITGAYDAATDTYTFDDYFTEMLPYLQGDWVVGNLETPLAGKDLGYSGYPQFNAPSTLADALKDAGFNILTTANNHAMDRYEKGVLRTLEALQERNIPAVGTYASQEEADEILVVTKNDISMAILAYTYGVNGITIPADKPYLVNLIDEDKIAADIQKAKGLGVDVVTVALHMEGEYHRMPNEGQKKLTQFVVEAGADIILGNHPHVVQPYEVVEIEDEAGTTRQAVIIYSMGNFISNQGPPRTAKYTDIGIVFDIVIQKHYPDEVIEIKAIDSTVTWVHRYSEAGKTKYRILPIDDVLANRNDEDSKDPLLQAEHYQLLETYAREMEQHVHAFIEQ